MGRSRASQVQREVVAQSIRELHIPGITVGENFRITHEGQPIACIRIMDGQVHIKLGNLKHRVIQQQITDMLVQRYGISSFHDSMDEEV